MEDLSDLFPELVRERGELRLIARVTSQVAVGGQLADEFVRPADKAVVEHELARQALAEFAKFRTHRLWAALTARVPHHLASCAVAGASRV